MLFRVVSILGFVGVLLLIPLQAACCPVAPIVQGPLPKRHRFLYRLLRLVMLLLALTGLTAAIGWDGPMRGWLLMIHVAVAPLFALAIALLALAWADRYQYSKTPRPTEPDSWQKFLFWAMLTLALAAILSAVIPMTPLFGQHFMELLYQTHRYSSLFLVFTAILYGVRFASTR